jgi:hypothetical protein
MENYFLSNPEQYQDYDPVNEDYKAAVEKAKEKYKQFPKIKVIKILSRKSAKIFQESYFTIRFGSAYSKYKHILENARPLTALKFNPDPKDSYLLSTTSLPNFDFMRSMFFFLNKAHQYLLESERRDSSVINNLFSKFLS